MTAVPTTTAKKLGLVIDLDSCVGCHACAVSCKEWNTGGYSAPLTDQNPYGKEPDGVWFNRVHTYETRSGENAGRTVHFPRACLHCEQPACVTVCPTGASFKRAEDGIVLVNPDTCIGCKLCSWACPYGAREYDANDGIMKKCTLCVDRIYNQNIEPSRREPACVSACPTNARHFGDFADPDSNVSKMTEARSGYDLMPESGYRPTWKYLLPRNRKAPTSVLPMDKVNHKPARYEHESGPAGTADRATRIVGQNRETAESLSKPGRSSLPDSVSQCLPQPTKTLTAGTESAAESPGTGLTAWWGWVDRLLSR